MNLSELQKEVSEGFFYRLLTSGDAQAFKALRLQSLNECPHHFGETYRQEADISLEVIANRLTRTDDQVIVGAFAMVLLWESQA